MLVGFGWLMFGVAVRGRILDLGGVALGAATFAGLGLLVAARPRTIEAVSGWMNLVQLPMWLLSGSFFSYARFPAAVQPAIRPLPLTALNDALRAVINQGAPLHTTWPELLVMLVWGGSPSSSPCASSAGSESDGEGRGELALTLAASSSWIRSWTWTWTWT